MAAFPKIHWARILIGGFLAAGSVWTFLLATPIFFAQQSSRYSSPLASMLACFLFAIWVGRRVDGSFLLHGTLAAAVAIRKGRKYGIPFAATLLAQTWGRRISQG